MCSFIWKEISYYFLFSSLFNMNYDVFQLQGGFFYLLMVNITQWWGEIGMFYICLSPSINVSKTSKNSSIFKFEFIHCLLMLLFLLSNGLNAIYLNLSNIDISVINAYLVNLMYAVILYCFSEQLWVTICRIVMSGDIEVTPGPKHNSKVFQSAIGNQTV